ncbi:MAG: LysR family transcriptional regulator [Pseudomonadota bacterium]
MDRLTEMEAFATVVDQGGFTGAARKLQVSKSAISKHVSSLEARLGVRLLNRTTRRVNPTEIGLVYYERAQEVLVAAREADGMVGALQSEPEGLLRVAVTPDYGRSVIAPRLSEFLEAYPSVSVDLVLIDRPVELNSEGFDLSIAPGAASTSNAQSRILDSYALELVAAPAYLDAHGHPARVEDLVSHVLLHGGGGEVDGAWRLTAQTGEVRTVRARPRIAINNSEVVADMTLQGLGLALLPDYVIGDALRDGQLRRVIPSLPTQTRHIVATLPPKRHLNPRVSAFLDLFDRSGSNGFTGNTSTASR